MPNSKKRCRECREYKPAETMVKHPIGTFCGDSCVVSFSQKASVRARAKKKEKEDKEFRKETKARKEAIKSRGDYLKDAQREFNRFIRLRDHVLPCVCCDRHHDGQYHAGHFLSVGSHPELRFNEDNCHKQASYCNNHKSGNQAQYRIRLKERIGTDRVNKLEGPHEPAKLSIDDIKKIRQKYKLKADVLEIELGLK